MSKETADVGGWLADYCYTMFLVLLGQAKPDARYRVVENKQYRSLAKALMMLTDRSMVAAGNVIEQLCWHAFEQDNTEGAIFVLAVIWNTTNRALSNEAHSSDESCEARNSEERSNDVFGT